MFEDHISVSVKDVLTRSSEYTYFANAYFMTDYRKRIYTKGEEISVSMM